jgi:tape measure domain-containing protein
MATERIEIIVTDRGTAKKVSRDISSIGPAADRASGKARVLTRTLRDVATVSRDIRNLFLILGASRTIGFVNRATNEFKSMNNTLRGFGTSAKLVDGLRKQIVAVANSSRVGASETTVFFGRLKKATKDLGLSDRQVLELTGTAQRALRLGGASANEATQAVRQLSQAFNKGKLDGDEFRSTLENAPVLAELLSDRLGISKSQLQKFAEEGKITTQVLVAALQNGKQEIDRLFGTLEQTTDDAFTVIRNNIVQYIGEIDRAHGISQSFINGLNAFAQDVPGNMKAAFELAAASALLLSKSIFRIGLRLSPIALGVLAFKRMDEWIKDSTGGARGLFSVLKDVADIIEKVAQGIYDAATATGKLGSERDKKRGLGAELSNSFSRIAIFDTIDTDKKLQSEIDKRIIAYVEKQIGDARTRRYLPDALKTNSAEQILKDVRNPAGDFVERGQRNIFEKMARDASLLFTGTVPPPALNDLGKQMADYLARVRNQVIDDMVKETQAELKLMDPASEGNALVAGQRARAASDFQEARRAQVTGELETRLQSIQSIIDQAGTETGSLANEVSRVASALQEYAKGIESTAGGIEEAKRLYEQLGPVLEKLENTTNDEAVINSLRDEIPGLLEELRQVEEKVSKLPEEQKQIGLAKIQEITQQADAIMKAASEQTATAIVGAYEKVLAKMAQIAAAANINLGTTGVGAATDPFAGPAYEGSGGGAFDAQSELSGLRDQLQGVRDDLNAMNDTGVRAFNNLGSSARGFGQQAGSIGNELNNVFTNTFSSLENAIVSFVQTGKFDFKSLINSMLADLARLLVRMLIIRPLMGLFGGFFGFSGGGLVGGGFGGGFGGLGFANGGRVPDMIGGKQIPRFARGTGGVIPGYGSGLTDRYLAAVAPGEFVVNAEDTRRNYADLVSMNNGNRVERKSSGGNPVTINNNTTVNMGGSGGGDNDATRAKQIARYIDNELDRKMTEFVSRQSRSGGLLAKQGSN